MSLVSDVLTQEHVLTHKNVNGIVQAQNRCTVNSKIPVLVHSMSVLVHLDSNSVAMVHVLQHVIILVPHQRLHNSRPISISLSSRCAAIDNAKTHFRYKITKTGGTSADTFVSDLYTVGTTVKHTGSLAAGTYTVTCLYGTSASTDAATMTTGTCTKPMEVKDTGDVQDVVVSMDTNEIHFLMICGIRLLLMLHSVVVVDSLLQAWQILIVSLSALRHLLTSSTIKSYQTFSMA